MSQCLHTNTTAVYAYIHVENPQVGDPVELVNDGKPVAHLCLDCDEQLHPGWGCGDCDWFEYEERAMCEAVATVYQVLRTPCEAHR